MLEQPYGVVPSSCENVLTVGVLPLIVAVFPLLEAGFAYTENMIMATIVPATRPIAGRREGNGVGTCPPNF